MADGLLLRDVKLPPAPSWWPPAPGWWLLAGVVLLAFAAWSVLRARRRRRREAAQRLFDDALAGAASPAARLAVASELLRRASRRLRPDADRLDGDAWLAWLDSPRARFVDGPGRLLLDGAYRPAVPAAEAGLAIALARTRFVELMEARA